MSRWTWDPGKASTNLRKHGVDFELAARALDDPFVLLRLDPMASEERWQALGRPHAGNESVLFVVHTISGVLPDGRETGRIMSARKADRIERKRYEQGQEG